MLDDIERLAHGRVHGQPRGLQTDTVGADVGRHIHALQQHLALGAELRIERFGGTHGCRLVGPVLTGLHQLHGHQTVQHAAVQVVKAQLLRHQNGYGPLARRRGTIDGDDRYRMIFMVFAGFVRGVCRHVGSPSGCPGRARALPRPEGRLQGPASPWVDG